MERELSVKQTKTVTSQNTAKPTPPPPPPSSHMSPIRGVITHSALHHHRLTSSCFHYAFVKVLINPVETLYWFSEIALRPLVCIYFSNNLFLFLRYPILLSSLDDSGGDLDVASLPLLGGLLELLWAVLAASQSDATLERSDPRPSDHENHQVSKYLPTSW